MLLISFEGALHSGENLPLKGIEASCRRGSSLRDSIQCTFGEIYWFPSWAQRCRVHSSARGYQLVLFALERRSCLRGVGHGAAVSDGYSRAGPPEAVCACFPWLAWLPEGSEWSGEKHTWRDWAIRRSTHPRSSKSKFGSESCLLRQRGGAYLRRCTDVHLRL